MEIKIVKFGNTLVFRDRGREAFNVLEPQLKDVTDSENITLDFIDVLTLSPSWGDEVISPLSKKYGDKLLLKNTSNSSIKATLDILKKTNKEFKFNILS